GVLVLQRDHPGFPIKLRDFAPVAARALERELERLQSGRRDDAVTLDLRLPREEQREEPRKLADGKDPIRVTGVLEAIDRIADLETLRPQKSLVDQIDA